MMLQETLDNEMKQLKIELELQRNSLILAEVTLEADLTTCKIDLKITKKEVKSKQEEITLLSSAQYNGKNANIPSNDLTNCLKLLSEANEEKVTTERSLTIQRSKEKLIVDNQVVDLTNKNKRLNSMTSRVKFNDDFIMKEIRNVYHKPDGIACIINKSLENRLKAITGFMVGNTRLEYKQPDEVTYLKKNLKTVEELLHYNSYADITNKLNNNVKDMNPNPTSHNYESILTFFKGVVTAILRRIVKDKIEDFIHNKRCNNSNSDRSNISLNTFISFGVPIISSSASRISSALTR
uniref:DUF4806 domain-containing protein n=1 Tax=Strongyloides venezuelensis TaxID=75913 RepID=A0A0K0FJT5_STRVS